MKEINFVCRWSFPKESSWSGTHLNILNSLKKIYSVTEINLKNYKIISLLKKLKFIRLAYFLQNMIDKNKIKKQAKGNILFMFDAIYVGKRYKHYIYIDLSYSLLLYLNENENEKYKNSSFNYTRSQLLFFSKKQNRYFEKCDCIFSMSNYLNKFLYESNKNYRIKTVYAGVNVFPSKIEKKAQGRKLLFVGKDYIRKSGDVVYNTFLKLKKEYSDIELYFAGPKINPFDNVEGYHFLGELSPNKLKNYFELCDIYCMPSKFEAFGIVFCEALLHGMPIIAYNDYEMRNIISDKYGVCINEISESEIIKSVIYLFDNKEIGQNIKDDFNLLSSTYSWDTVAEKIKVELNR